MPLTSAQSSFLNHWLKKRKDPVHLRGPERPGGERAQTQELPLLTPTQESLLEHWLKKPVAPPKSTPPARHRESGNPKWDDDTWFEGRYGDPDYYTRVKGLS